MRSSSNPVLTRTEAFARPNQRYATFDAPSSDRVDPQRLEDMYAQPAATNVDRGLMTIDDVVTKTGIMLGVLLVAGTATWVLGLGFLLLPALVVGLVLALVIAFKQVTNPAAHLVYAATQGVVLGAISRIFEMRYPGIAVQAVLGTTMVAGGALYAYKSGRIRVTPRFTKMVVAATLGFLGLIVVNLLASFFVDGGLGIRDGGPLAILVSVFAIGLAALNLVIDFEFIKQGAAQGLPEKYGWLAAFGLIVTLVWLYIEILRLLSYLRGDD